MGSTAPLSWEEHSAIADLFTRFANALDFKNWGELDDIFADDVIADWPMGLRTEGRTALIDFIKQALDTDEIKTHHMWGNLRASVDGDTAEASVHMRAHHAGVGPRAGMFEESLLVFDSRLVRTPTGWRVTSWDEQILVMLGSSDLFFFGKNQTD